MACSPLARGPKGLASFLKKCVCGGATGRLAKGEALQHPGRLEKLSRAPSEAPRKGSDNAQRKPRPDFRGAVK